MLAEGLVVLAQFAGQTVAAAAITDVWESARHRFAWLLSRGDPKKTEVAERWLEETREQLTEAAGTALEPVRAAQAQRWQGRFADLLDEDPGIEADLRALVEEIQAALPAGVVSAADHSVAAGGDVNITAAGGGVAAGVIHGGVDGRPSGAGSGEGRAGYGTAVAGPSGAAAAGGGVAAGAVEQLTVYQLGSVPGRPEAVTSQPVSLPPRPVFLAGREEFLAGLDARLTGGPGTGPQVVALYGLGGAGKTSVAVEYAHRHLADVGLAWQFLAEDPEVLLADFARLAAQLDAREVADVRDPVVSVHTVLAAFGTPWLLVFDNAAGQEMVQRFLPPAGNGRILITSQSAVWPGGWAVQVPVLGTEVAAEFLVNRTGDPDREAAATLAGELGGLPLALEQAAAYTQATGTTLAGYVSVFRDRRAELMARGEASGHPAHLAATLGLALTRLAEQAPAAAGALRLLACLAPEPVPLALLLVDEQIAGKLAPAVAAEVEPLLGDRVGAGDAVAALRRYSLVTPAGDGLVLVHRLVQAVTLAQVPAGVAAQWEQAAAALVEAAIPADPELPAAWPVCAVLLPHARAVLDLTSGGMWRIANYLGSSGSYRAARDMFQLIADALREDDTYGAEHRDTLAARGELARWTGVAGDAAGARERFAALLPVRERILGPEHPDTLHTRASLATWTGDAGDAAGARERFAALLPVRERILGPEHPDTLHTRHLLAFWTWETGDEDGACAQYAALLSIRERILGPEHPDTRRARRNFEFWSEEAAKWPA